MKRFCIVLCMLFSFCFVCSSCSGVLHPDDMVTVVTEVFNGESYDLQTLVRSTESGYVLLPLNEGETLDGEKTEVKSGDIIRMYFADKIYIRNLLLEGKEYYVYNLDPIKIVVAIRGVKTEMEGDYYLFSIPKSEIGGEFTIGGNVSAWRNDKKVGYNAVINKIDEDFVVVKLWKTKLTSFIMPLFEGAKLKATN